MSEQNDHDRFTEIQNKGQELSEKMLQILNGYDLQIGGAALSYTIAALMETAIAHGYGPAFKATLIKTMDILTPDMEKIRYDH